MACRTPRPKRELVRIVRGPQGGVSFDTTGRAPGRGAYLCRDGACWTLAVRRRSLEHALDVELPGDLAARLTAGPEAGLTEPPNLAAVPGSRDPETPDPMTQGGARGQE